MKTFILLLLVSIFAFAAEEKPPAPIVTVVSAKKVDLFETLTYPARVVPKINANVLAESDGVVSKILAPLGQRVSRHQKLMVIRHTDPVYQYAPVISTAPVSGVVSLVDVTEGSLVTKGQRLATVTDPAQVRVIVEIAAADLSLVSAGLSGELNVAGLAKPLSVKVRGVSPFVDPATGTATCELEAKTGGIAPGIVGQVTFKANLHQGYSLPDHAIVYKGNDTFVRVVENGKARQLAVMVGRKERGHVEIVKGLNDGLRVVERTSGFIADGDTVNVQEKSL